nr:hypothetical protein CFP56_31805 [Quercus suber]
MRRPPGEYQRGIRRDLEVVRAGSLPATHRTCGSDAQQRVTTVQENSSVVSCLFFQVAPKSDWASQPVAAQRNDSRFGASAKPGSDEVGTLRSQRRQRSCTVSLQVEESNASCVVRCGGFRKRCWWGAERRTTVSGPVKQAEPQDRMFAFLADVLLERLQLTTQIMQCSCRAPGKGWERGA